MASPTNSDQGLISLLERWSVNDEFAGKSWIRKSEHAVWGHRDMKIIAWKINEYKFFDKRNPPKIWARGLFTLGDRIVARGYDKFFNIGEFPTSTWENIADNTKEPYDVTVKENGCLILVAGYKGKLIVTSKHSCGPHEGMSRNHSEMGKIWVIRHLNAAGKTESELADELEKRSLTMVGELCDDAFEEHVLPYRSEKRGIYVTGLNSCEKTFKTRPIEEVISLANKYGFHQIQFVRHHSLESLRNFLDSCAVTGTFNDENIEGFVIRCKRHDQDFFFKYKFEEPYAMFRAWRELTRAYVADPVSVSTKIHGHYKTSSLDYFRFLRPYLDTHPELKSKLKNDGNGFIQLREAYLESAKMSHIDLLSMSSQKTKKFVIIPIATIGCGKTTLSIALSRIFGWAHVQNDDMKARKGKSKRDALINAAISKLVDHDVVIIDRNNHQKHERAQILTSMLSTNDINSYDVFYVGLNFLPYGPDERSWEITSQRVKSRKGMHQTITNMNERKILGIMRGFEKRFEVLDLSKYPDTMFDLVINVDIEDSLSSSVEKVRTEMNEYFHLGLRAEDEIFDQAVDAALKYRAQPINAAKSAKQVQKTKPLPKVIYFGIRVSLPMVDLVAEQFKASDNAAHWCELQQNQNWVFENTFHVTLAYYSESGSLYQKLITKFEAEIKKISGSKILELEETENVEFVEVCYNTRIMAVRVSLETDEFRRKGSHITIGHLRDVKPVESNEMLAGEHEVVRWTLDLKGATRQRLYASLA